MSDNYKPLYPEKNDAISSTEYLNWRSEYIINVFEYQYYSGVIIFIFVLIIVSIGLALSIIQFRQMWKDEFKNSTVSQSEVQISGANIKISSPVIGLIILIISLGFFYLYLDHVYRIEIIEMSVSLPPSPN